MDLQSVQRQAWDNKVRKGYNSTEVTLEICLLHEKASNVFASWRKGEAHIGEDLADIVLYAASVAEMTGLSLESEVAAKIAKNSERTD